MKFNTGEKTIKHDGKTYGPDGEIDLDEEQGRAMGLEPVNKPKVHPLKLLEPGDTTTLKKDQADLLNQAVNDGRLVLEEDEEEFAEGDVLELAEEHVQIFADAATSEGGQGGDGPAYIADMTITLMPAEAKILVKHLGPGVEGRMYKKGEVIALRVDEATLLETQSTNQLRQARQKRNQKG